MSSEVDEDLVIYLAEVARLKLSEEEVKKFSEQLKVIIDAFKDLDGVDTENVDPSFHPLKLPVKLREDLSEKWFWDPLANTLHKEGKYFKGPKII
jgi:aspartyl-tRNA(Asn)/glutamyl-tRNA(Gln) amidotransferase subunit C